MLTSKSSSDEAHLSSEDSLINLHTMSKSNIFEIVLGAVLAFLFVYIACIVADELLQDEVEVLEAPEIEDYRLK